MATIHVEAIPLCQMKDRNWTDYVLVYEQNKVEQDGPSDRLEVMRKKFEKNLEDEGLILKRLEGIEDTAQLVS